MRDLVLLVRHALGLSANEDAVLFDASDPEFQEIVKDFIDRASIADPSEAALVDEDMKRLIMEWSRLVLNAGETGGLYYSYPGREHARLLRRFTESGEGWPTLDSMRSVDVEIKVGVRGPRGARI